MPVYNSVSFSRPSQNNSVHDNIDDEKAKQHKHLNEFRREERGMEYYEKNIWLRISR